MHRKIAVNYTNKNFAKNKLNFTAMNSVIDTNNVNVRVTNITEKRVHNLEKEMLAPRSRF